MGHVGLEFKPGFGNPTLSMGFNEQISEKMVGSIDFGLGDDGGSLSLRTRYKVKKRAREEEKKKKQRKSKILSPSLDTSFTGRFYRVIDHLSSPQSVDVTLKVNSIIFFYFFFGFFGFFFFYDSF